MGELIERKKRILLNEPHLVHAPVGDEFDVVIAEPKLSGMRIYFDPVYKGNGTPSVNNKYSIQTWGSVTVYIGNDAIDMKIGYPNTEYYPTHGYYDCDSGTLYFDWVIQELSDSGATSYSNRGSSSIFWQYAGSINIYNNPTVDLKSNMFTFVGNHYNYDSVPDWSFAGASAYPNSFWMKVPNSVLPELSLNGAKAWLANNHVRVVGPRKSGAMGGNIGNMDVFAKRGLQHVSTANVWGNVTTEFYYWTH